jgi:hypothetical protein
MAHYASTPPLLLPDICCVCLGEADAIYNVGGKTHKESGWIMVTKWPVPVCSACRQRLIQSRPRRLLSMLVVCLALVGSFVLATRFGYWIVLLIAAGIAGSGALWRGTVGGPAVVGWTVLDEKADCGVVNSSQGRVLACQIPRFENPLYDQQFREMNGLDYGHARVESGLRNAEEEHLANVR